MARGGGHRDDTGSNRNRVSRFFAPWWAMLGAYMFAAVIRWVGRQQAPGAEWISLAEGVAMIALALVAYDAGRARGQHVQIQATAFTFCLVAWVSVVTIVGPFTRGAFVSWLLLFGFVAAHSIRTALRGQADDSSGDGSSLGRAIADAKRRVSSIRVDRDTGIVTATVEADRTNETIKEVQTSLSGQIESMGKLPPGSATIDRSRTDAGKGNLRIVPRNPLEQSLVWPGPTHVGKSIELALRPGMYVTNEPVKLWLPGDPRPQVQRNASHWKVMGVNGAGKSMAVLGTMTESLCRNDFALIGSDHIKGLQTFGPMIEHMAWANVCIGDDTAGAKKRTRIMMTRIRALGACNADLMGRHGYTQWTHEVFVKLGIPLTVFWLEEAPEITADSPTFIAMCQTLRSLGILIIWSGQRAAWTSIETDARSQLATEWCFGVSETKDNGFGLPEIALDAGADPSKWGNREPGMSYLVAPGIPAEQWSTELRAWTYTHEMIGNVLSRWASRVELHDEGKRALGEPYANRMKFGATPGAPLIPVLPATVTPAPATGIEPAEETDMVDQDTPDAIRDSPDEGEGMTPLLPALTPDDGDPTPVGGAKPIGGVDPADNFSFGIPEPVRRLTTDEARAVIQQHLRKILEEGRDRTTPAEVHRMRPATTRTAEWCRTELVRLCEEPGDGDVGLVRDVDEPPGVFLLRAPVAHAV